MNFIWPSRKPVSYESSAWRESKAVPGVHFQTRKMSLGQKIELLQKAQQLSRNDEFLRAGSAADELEAGLSDLLVRRLYLQWGLLGVRGLRIDGVDVTSSLLIERGPEALTQEIIEILREEIGLTDDERKNF